MTSVRLELLWIYDTLIVVVVLEVMELMPLVLRELDMVKS